MTPVSIDRIDGFWASYLGCSSDDLRSSRTVVVPCGASGYEGVHLFRRSSACIVSVPPLLLEKVTVRVAHRAPAEVFDRDFLKSVFRDDVERIVGPAYLGHLDSSGFRPVDHRGARQLGPEDENALRHLAAACHPDEWENSSIQFDRPPLFGCIFRGAMVAAGKLLSLNEHLLFVGIVTHPDYRGQGYGKAVVSAMTEHGLRSGKVLVYRTLSTNYPSLGIAASLGYEEYATTLAVRLSCSDQASVSRDR